MMSIEIEAASTTARAPILMVRDLSVEFWVNGDWVTAASALTYDVHRGETLAIVGESGSGKSTGTLAMLGLVAANARVSGSAKLSGVELIDAPKQTLRSIRGGRVGVIFQDPMIAMNPVYRIGDQIVEAILAHRRGMHRQDATAKALLLLSQVELPDPNKAFRSFPHELSGGQLQRAMIAQALCCEPELLIADEPTTALDVTVQAEILELLRGLQKRLNMGMVLITHDMGVVADIADHVMVMRNGRVVENVPTERMFASPEDAYTKELLASVPRLGVVVSSPRNSMERTPVLSVHNLVVDYGGSKRSQGFRAVDDVSFDIAAGEVLGLVGESGSGKSTVGGAIAGFTSSTSGQILIDGLDVLRRHGASRSYSGKLGFVFQDPGSSLDPRWTVAKAIAEPLHLAGGEISRDTNRKVLEMLDRVALSRSFASRFPHELSGGQRQRVAIARALIRHPELLIADEPTSALDVSVQARVMELFKQLQHDLQFACLFITHNLAVVEMLSDRVAVMKRGRIVEMGGATDVLRNPTHEYTRRLVSAVPVPDPAAQRQRRSERLAVA